MTPYRAKSTPVKVGEALVDIKQIVVEYSQQFENGNPGETIIYLSLLPIEDALKAISTMIVDTTHYGILLDSYYSQSMNAEVLKELFGTKYEYILQETAEYTRKTHPFEAIKLFEKLRCYEEIFEIIIENQTQFILKYLMNIKTNYVGLNRNQHENPKKLKEEFTNMTAYYKKKGIFKGFDREYQAIQDMFAVIQFYENYNMGAYDKALSELNTKKILPVSATDVLDDYLKKYSKFHFEVKKLYPLLIFSTMQILSIEARQRNESRQKTFNIQSYLKKMTYEDIKFVAKNLSILLPEVMDSKKEACKELLPYLNELGIKDIEAEVKKYSNEIM
mmetsp:Transcript_14950/g.16589  ORF Transcript_14950/g.16589 Transcript_14950/m.16589 type:complete len:333 (+) Transcript_14950:1-999(+)